tara:strand:- start:79 stop:966 length:888 start_codon:yes stop_codon:yes gene_type:complete
MIRRNSAQRMRFKGGSSAPTETTVTQTSIPDEVMPQFKGLLARSEFESNQPYLPYPQARLAGFSPAERMAQRGFGAMAQYGSPMETRMASQGLANLPNTMTSRIADAYMSPYFSQALDPTKNEAIRQSALQARGIRDSAASSGGLGGYREAIMQSNRQRDLNRQLTDLEKVGRQDAFMDASRRFEADRQARMAQIQGLAGLGLQRQEGATSRLRNLQNIGEQQRALQQASMDIGYQDFLRQQGYPQQQLGFYENILKGTYSRPDQTVSTFNQRPGIFAGLTGLGLQAAGLGRMFS